MISIVMHLKREERDILQCPHFYSSIFLLLLPVVIFTLLVLQVLHRRVAYTVTTRRLDDNNVVKTSKWVKMHYLVGENGKEVRKGNCRLMFD